MNLRDIVLYLKEYIKDFVNDFDMGIKDVEYFTEEMSAQKANKVIKYVQSVQSMQSTQSSKGTVILSCLTAEKVKTETGKYKVKITSPLDKEDTLELLKELKINTLI